MVTVVPVALGIAASLAAEPLWEALAWFGKALWSFAPGGEARFVLVPDGWAILFWTAVVGFTGALRVRLAAEDAAHRRTEGTREERQRQLVAAIYHAPNMDVLTAFPATHRAVLDALGERNRPTETPEEVRLHHMRRLLVALAPIATMVQTFSRYPPSTRFGANVMLALTADKYATLGSPPLRFLAPGVTAESAENLLVLLPELILPQLDTGSPVRDVPSLAIAVHPPVDLQVGSFPTLPGAPKAVRSDGGFSVEYDTRATAARYGFEPNSELARYFSEGGEGRDIRSFLALRLEVNEPEGRRTVGVLNIDTSVPRILGASPTDADDADDPLYVDAFVSLLRPLAQLLGPVVAEYTEAALASPPELTRDVNTADEDL